MREVRHAGLFCGMRTMKMATPAPTTMTSTTMTAVVLFAAATIVVLPESSEGRRNKMHIHSFIPLWYRSNALFLPPLLFCPCVNPHYLSLSIGKCPREKMDEARPLFHGRNREAQKSRHASIDASGGGGGGRGVVYGTRYAACNHSLTEPASVACMPLAEVIAAAPSFCQLKSARARTQCSDRRLDGRASLSFSSTDRSIDGLEISRKWLMMAP